MKKFIILTNARNGSTWFGDTLNHADNIVCHDELLVDTLYRKDAAYLASDAYKMRVAEYPHWQYHKKRNDISGFTPRLLKAYLDEKLKQNSFGGFKLMFKQLIKHPSVFFYIFQNKLSIIRLKRENYLDIAISQETMKYRERGHNREKIKQIQVYMPPEQTLKEIRKCAFWDYCTDLFCKIMPVPVLYISYEELTKNNEIWEEIFKFLTGDVPKTLPKGKYKKSNTSTQREIIENYQEIADLLKLKGYGYLLKNEAS